jgi:hypothetical protein
VLCSTSLVVMFFFWFCRAAEGLFRRALRSSSRIELDEGIPWRVGDNVRDEVPVQLCPSEIA